MRPSEIFDQYQDNKIDRSTAIPALKSFLENSSDDEIRIDALKYLGLVMPRNNESFKYFEQLLLSDLDDWIRGTAAEIIINDYLEEGEKVLKWVINNENSITCLIKIFKSLNADTRKEAKLLITFMEQTLEKRFSDLKIYKREEIGLGHLERLMGKVQDYLLYIDDLLYLRKDQIYNLLEEIKELIRDTNLEHIDRKYARILRTIGEYYTPLHCTDDDLREAIIAYKLSLRLDPDNEEAWCYLGGAYQSLNEFDNTKRIYKRAIEYNPSFNKVVIRLALLYNSLDEYEEEKETYEYVLKHNPERFSSWRALGKAYNSCGEYDKAIDAFERYIEKNPKHYKYYDLNELCYSYIKLGDFNKAEELVNKVLKHKYYKLKNITTLTNLLLIYQERGNLDKVNELYKEIIELEPRSLRDIENLVKLHIKMNQFDKALEIIDSMESEPSYRGKLMSKLRKKIGLKELEKELNHP